MSNSVRLTNSVPVEIAERLENYAKVNGGITTTQALIALIVHYTPKLRDDVKDTHKTDSATITPSQPTTQPKPQPQEGVSEVQHWKRKEPLTSEELKQYDALARKYQNNQNMTALERTQLYAYAERYENHH